MGQQTCVYVSRICILNLNLLAFTVPEISTFIRLLILIKNKYTLLSSETLLPVTYFSTNIVYPFTLRVTGINTTERITIVIIRADVLIVVEQLHIHRN